ncbi:MAG: pyridoxamine 5'-phosphate oxidase family protein [Bacilli bacterium]|nr:pyridoxamine 5'-phosphate oxidase family protein [Bacilli bacterium]
MMRDVEKTIGNLIDKQKVAFLSSIDADGYPNGKVMYSPRKREGIKVFYLTTNTSSKRVQQFLSNPKASIYFFDKRFFRGVMLKGNVEVLTDLFSKEMLWQENDEMYYAKGVSDPDYCVLKITCFAGRYYSNFKSEDFIIK